MIEISTTLSLEGESATKRVVVSMSAEDALAMHAILANASVDADGWQEAVSCFARELLKAGNRCR